MAHDKAVIPEMERPTSEDALSTPMQELYVELIKASPKLLLAILLAVLALLFYDPLSRLLDRSTKIGFGPVSFEAAEKKLKEWNEKDMEGWEKKGKEKENFSEKEVKEHTSRYSDVMSKVRHANLLWVDDDPQDNKVFVDFFELFGIRVVTARSSSEAVDRLQERSFSAVITDWNRKEDSLQLKASATGEQFWGAGARLGHLFAESCSERNVVIFSWGSTTETPVPPRVKVATDNRNTLLETIANMIEKPVECDIKTTAKAEFPTSAQLTRYRQMLDDKCKPYAGKSRTRSPATVWDEICKVYAPQPADKSSHSIHPSGPR
ncbi:MAG TPA: hypothetical protein VK472_02590 [Allosphingosinicella sp.]|nr:hypothetical protein [Allosphingosinicella sp.]